MIKVLGLLFIVFALLSSCTPASKNTSITVSIAPEKFFVERIAGEKYQVSVLVPTGTNPETYDPTPKDIAALAHSSIYFYMGSLPFEKVWLKAIQEQNTGIRCVDISTYLPESLHECTHGHGHTHGDPHFWTSIKGAVAIARGIYDALMDMFPEDAKLFATNYAALLDEIHALEAELSVKSEGISSRTFVIYHPSLTFFAEEWGLNQRAIERDGKEPTPAYLAELIDAAKRDNVKVVFVQEEFDTRSAETVAREIGARIVKIQPMDEDWIGQMRHLIDAFVEP